MKKFLKIIIVFIFIEILLVEANNVVATTTKPNLPAPNLTYVSINDGIATLKWEKVKGADGYAIYMSKCKNGRYTKKFIIKDSNCVTYKIKGLKQSTEYFFKIRPFVNIDNKRVYSNKYSNIRSGGGLLISKKLTAVSSTYARNVNLKIASNKINGTILKPGQNFNWWKVLGPLSESKGYQKAIAYVNGNNILSVGGGICQVSTNVYQCAKASGMKIIERHEHGKAVTYIQSGEDATVTYGFRNLIFKNTYPYAIKILAGSQENSTFCQFYKIGDI